MKRSNNFGGCMTIPLALILLLAVFTLYSQWAAHTPAITGSDGKPKPGSIASLEAVKLGGAE